MSKRWQPLVKLITTGIIISDLHFGPFLKDWWYIRMTLQKNVIRAKQYYPFQVGIGMKTQRVLRLGNDKGLVYNIEILEVDKG
ncbi:hypothetical protein Glove_213g83 [Diversispora epigaea]|uniref:Uncharacterized protein n=1 Tax=Diversispora epigaea TaxID=1348612 RepID=A0A397IQT3_9GLOM|nr:hypothetical protein Glove_213g83 [Diversispora epigaea]